MNRREFLQRSSVLAGAAYLNAPAFADAISTLGDPNLIIGIVSDIHICGTIDLVGRETAEAQGIGKRRALDPLTSRCRWSG